MSTTASSFYVTGGTLRHDAPSYVERQADRDLYDALSRGDFCYVLTARQMGKSSLMVRTAARLRQEGVAVAILDFTAIGQNLSPEQWYGGLLHHLGVQLDLEDELDEFWLAQERFGPLQRWMLALRQVILARVPGALTIFIDEIDAVRSLPFSTDEFFAGIRECYNRRTEDAAYERLTFCLLGVATPSDLIQDIRMTPFNIGRRIELTDFTAVEAAPLAGGLSHEGGNGQRLLQQVFHWTSGHPYLTQRLCQVSAEDPKATGPVDIDRHCEALFLAASAQENDDNLLFVRERLLRSGADLAGLLDLYRQVREGKRVAADDTNQLAGLLRLSGATRLVEGHLQVRNRIYERVFDRAWVEAHMPDAELRRQRAAYRRGLLRATAIASVVVAVIAGLAFRAVRAESRTHHALRQARHERDRAVRAEQQQRALRLVAERARAATKRSEQEAQRSAEARRQEARRAVRERGRAELATVREAQQRALAEGQQQRADEAAERARGAATQEREQRRLAQERTLTAQRALYGVQMNLAQQAWETGNVRRGLELLDALRPQPGQEDRRGFEWRLLWRLCQGDARCSFRPRVRGEYFVDMLPSPDGRSLLTVGEHGDVELWNVTTGREVATLPGRGTRIYAAAFSPDSRRLALGRADALIQLWEPATRSEPATLRGHQGPVHTLRFSPDGKLLASGSSDETVRLWDLSGATTPSEARGEQRLEIAALTRTRAPLCFSPDGSLLATRDGDGSVRLWTVPSRQEVAAFPKAGGPVAFSPDGSLFALGSGNTVQRYDVLSHREVAALQGQTSPITQLRFSPDGRILASGGGDTWITLWSAASGRELGSLIGHRGSISSLAFSPDGRILASGSTDSSVRLWEVATQRELRTLRGHQGAVTATLFSADGRSLTTLSPHERTVKQWDVEGTLGTGRVFRNGEVVSALTLSPEGDLLATGSEVGTVRLWDTRDLQLRRTLNGHAARVTAVTSSPDGRLLATSSEDGTSRVWETATGQLRAILRGHKPYGSALAFSPDSRLVATGGGSGDLTVRIWDASTGQSRAVLRGQRGPVLALAFSPDGETLAVSNRGWWGTATRLWRVSTQWPVAYLPRAALALTFSPDGRKLVTGDSRAAAVWDLATGRAEMTFKQTVSEDAALALSPDGRTLAVRDGSDVILSNIPSRQEVARLKGHTGAVTALAFSSSSQLLATAATDGTVRLWHAPPFPGTDTVQVIASSGDRRVRLEWQPVPHAVGYQIYCGPAGGDPFRLARVTARAGALAEFTDHRATLSNGRPVTYGVAPVFRDPAGRVVEPPPVPVEATPMAAPPGWLGYSLNEGPKTGSVRFDRATGQIRLRGSGWDVLEARDGAYFLYRRVTGNFQIRVTALSRPTSTEEWAKAGLMLRDSLKPDARLAFLYTTTGHGLYFQRRGLTDRPVSNDFYDGNSRVIEHDELRLPIVLRLTRRGNAVLAETSRDGGKSFEPAGAPLQFLERLPRELYVGLAITGHDATQQSSARFRELELHPLRSGVAAPAPPVHPDPIVNLDPLQVTASAGDRMVRLQWRPLPKAVGHHLYRGPVGATQAQMARLTRRPITGASFTDRSPTLANGRVFQYAVAPVFGLAGARRVEGDPVRLLVTPEAAPPGFVGSGIGASGRVHFRPADREISVRSNGFDTGGYGDGFYFLNRRITGDFQITVRVATRPQSQHENASAGLMLRESLDCEARTAALLCTPGLTLRFHWRPAVGERLIPTGPATVSSRSDVPQERVELPIWLRLTRRKDTVSAAVSTDGGQSFREVDPPCHFAESLPESLYVGLAATSLDPNWAMEVKFNDLQIDRLAKGQEKRQ